MLTCQGRILKTNVIGPYGLISSQVGAIKKDFFQVILHLQRHAQADIVHAGLSSRPLYRTYVQSSIFAFSPPAAAPSKAPSLFLAAFCPGPGEVCFRLLKRPPKTRALRGQGPQLRLASGGLH